MAVLYACGDIADGNDKQINFEKLVPVIVRLAENENVKGMVLRVNSPGGSVFGSDQIGEAPDYFMKKGKPLAVSMGVTMRRPAVIGYPAVPTRFLPTP